MILLENGRSCLYQWDTDQRLEIESDEITEVHFANAVTSPALVCEVYEEDGHRYANIPNILLQQIWPVQAYGCCDCRVREVEILKVVRREKPADYVYTETEVKNFSDLEARIKELEEHGAGSPGAQGPKGDPGKTAYQYAQDGGYTGTEEEFAEKLAQEIPEAYTLPAATADRLGGVMVGSDFVMDGETLAIADGLTLFDSVEVKEGEIIESFKWDYQNVKEIQIFAFFPKQETDERISGNIGGTGVYMPNLISKVADQYLWIRWEKRVNTFPLYGIQAAREGYHSPVYTLGMYLNPIYGWSDVPIRFYGRSGGYPVGTKISIYGRME